MDHFICSLFEMQVETVEEMCPTFQLDDELYEQIRKDCSVMEKHFEELNISAFLVDFQDEYQSAVLEYYIDALELTPDSDLLSILSHASELHFRNEEDQIVMTLIFRNLFSE